MEDTSIAALYRGFTFLANRVAGLRMQQLMGKTVTDDLPPLLAQPNPTETYFTTIAKIMYSLLFRGNAYLWIRSRDRKTNVVQSIYVLNPDEVSVTGDALNLYPEYRWTGKPGQLMIPGKDILHIPLNYWPGHWEGVSPISAFRLGLQGIKAEQVLARNLMVNDGTPSGLLEVHKPSLTKKEAEEILDVWTSADGLSGNGPRVTSDMATFTPLTFNPVDLQFIETRKFGVQEIARLLGLDPFFLGEQSGGSMTYSTTESLLRLAVTQTIGPDYLEPIEQAFSSLLLPGRSARFNVDEILRADLESRYRAGISAVQAGVITVNEFRESEGLSPVAGGDAVTDARGVAELIQKIYLGVGVMLSPDEARDIANRVGAGLNSSFTPQEAPVNA